MGFWQKLFNRKHNNTSDFALNNDVTSNSNQESTDVKTKSDTPFDDYLNNASETENTFQNPFLSLEYDNELNDEEPLPGINTL